MAHNIHGVITAFTYNGNLPNVMLTEGYHFIPFDDTANDGTPEAPIPPYGERTRAMTELIRELSFLGKCAYIETAYFGGIGTQIAESWEDGQPLEGPLISYDGVEAKSKFEHVTVVEGAINQTLKNMGIHRSAEQDEFDVVGLGRYRSNRKVIAESGQ